MIKNILLFYITLFIPLIFVSAILLIGLYPNTLYIPDLIRIIGIMFSCLGLYLWIVSMFQLGKYFGVLPRRQKRISRGLYQYFRHPMYIGITVTLTGLSVANGSKSGLLFTIFFIIPMLIIRALLEEKYLMH